MNKTLCKKPFTLIFLLVIAGTSVRAQHNFSKDELTGKGNPELVGDAQLRKDAYEAFQKMKAAAAEAGFKIKVVSGYRNFERQKNIFERKFQRFTSQGLDETQAIDKIIEYSTIPGTSRHHWGTDIDIIDDNAAYSGDVLVPEKFHGEGPFCKFREWLEAHANTFGFYIVYTDEKDRKGFKYEPWHYSYAPVSKPMLKEFQKKVNIKKMLLEAQIEGASFFTDMFIAKYYRENILDINPVLK